MSETFRNRCTQALTIVPLFTIAAFWLASFLLAYAPPPVFTERLWLEWLGRLIIAHHVIPNTLGPETIASTGAPWLAQEWLFGVILAFLGAHRLDLLTDIGAATIAAVPLIVTLIELRRQGASPIVQIIVTMVLTVAVSTGFQVRATIVSYAIGALIFAALRARGKIRFVVVPLIAILVNFHASAILFALLPLCILAFKLLRRRGTPTEIRSWLLLAVLALAASLASPFGVRMWQYAFSLASGEVHTYIEEWTPLLRSLQTTLGVRLFVGFMILLVPLLIDGARRVLRDTDIVLLLVLGALALDAERFVIYFYIAAIPVVFAPNAILTKLTLPPTDAPAAAMGFSIFVALLASVEAIVNIQESFRIFHETPGTASSARPFLRTPLAWSEPFAVGDPRHERVFCADFTYCNAYLAAGAQVFTDGRADAFPLAAWTDSLGFVHSRPGWQAQFKIRGINVVVATRHTHFDQAMQLDPDWRLGVSDADNDTFVRGYTGKPTPKT